MIRHIQLGLCWSSLLLSPFLQAQANTDPFEVRLVEEIKLSDEGLYFDGSKIPRSEVASYENNPAYDYIFGPRITPHGDCITRFGNYLFLTWYRGPESDRHVMLSRYNLSSGSLKTIAFEHRHTGFQNRPHLGESHNTIAVGICAKDETVHLLYDMHAYSANRPSDGSLRDDYFRYQVSLPGTATVSDEEFTADRFLPKQLYLKEGEDYRSLTYPTFFENAEGDLLVVMREGGHNNGKYQFAKYDGSEWSPWHEFNVLNAGKKGFSMNWGLYGDMKVIDGKLQIGFATRLADNNDRYVYNNGIHYAYSTDSGGLSDWFNADDEPVQIPVIDPTPLKVSEPGNVFATSEKNSIRITTGLDWTRTPGGALHFVVPVRNDITGTTKNVHTYRPPGDSAFSVTTEFPGGSLYPLGNYVYLIGLKNRKPVIHRAPEGTNDWEEVYSTRSGRSFRHGNVLISGHQLYYYLMENGSGSAQPIYLQIYQLDEPTSPASPQPAR